MISLFTHTFLLTLVLGIATEAFAYINIARLAAPLRIAFALSSTSWIQSNVVDRFSSKDKKEEDAPSTGR